MSATLKKLWHDYGIVGAVILFLGLYALYMLYDYTTSKGSVGGEKMSVNSKSAYQSAEGSVGGPSAPSPSVEGDNEEFARVSGMSGQGGNVGSCNKQMENPADLLPKDTNSQWGQLNPAGQGDLANINLLKAGYHIGIDTVGQTLRNANLQIRSEPANPQVNTGIWNQSTITPDFMRIPLELGQGGQ